MSTKSENKSMMEITVIGVGDAGINVIKNIYNKNIIDNVKTICINTNKKSFDGLDSKIKTIFLDDQEKNTGTFGNVAIGKIATKNAMDQIRESIKNSNLLILSAGLGGGTGSAALPLIAKLAKEMNIITIAIVNSPFSYEGTEKNNVSKVAIEELSECADSLFVISNNKLMNNYPDIIAADAFKLINNIQKNCIKAFIELFSETNSTIDVSSVDLINSIKNKGESYIGFGSGLGRNKISRALNSAINSKLIERSIKNATDIVLYIIGDPTVSMNEINQLIDSLKNKIKNNDLNIIFKFDINTNLVNEIQVTLIGTTFKKAIESQAVWSRNEKLLNNSQELLLEIGNTLEHDFSSFATGEISIPESNATSLNAFDDKGQEDLLISSEDANDDDIPFFLK